MTKVLKKGWKKSQAFSPAKLKKSVEKTAKDAKLSPARRKGFVAEIADPVIALSKKKRTVKATDLRRSLLGRIDRKSKAAGKAWRRYEKKKK